MCTKELLCAVVLDLHRSLHCARSLACFLPSCPSLRLGRFDRILSHLIASHHMSSHLIASHHVSSHLVTSHHVTSHHICRSLEAALTMLRPCYGLLRSCYGLATALLQPCYGLATAC